VAGEPRNPTTTGLSVHLSPAGRAVPAYSPRHPHLLLGRHCPLPPLPGHGRRHPHKVRWGGGWTLGDMESSGGVPGLGGIGRRTCRAAPRVMLPDVSGGGPSWLLSTLPLLTTAVLVSPWLSLPRS
jgi:hypothetical protein